MSYVGTISTKKLFFCDRNRNPFNTKLDCLFTFEGDSIKGIINWDFAGTNTSEYLNVSHKENFIIECL